MYLNIKIKEDFRTLKKDTEYKFDFTNQDRYLMVVVSLHLLISYVAFSATTLMIAVTISLDMRRLVV